MKPEKFPNQIKEIVDKFDKLENKKRYKFLLIFANKTFPVSRVLYNDRTKTASIKYSAQSPKEYIINDKFISALREVKIEKVSVIRKKLNLRTPGSHRRLKLDEKGIPITKRSKGMRKNREYNELEFKSMFDSKFISNELRDKLFLEKDLLGNSRYPKKAFKKVQGPIKEIVDEFLEKFENTETINEHYKIDNYKKLSLIVGKLLTNNKTDDPRFKTYRSCTVLHRQGDDHVQLISSSVKTGTDNCFYLINKDTILKIFKAVRYRNRG